MGLIGLEKEPRAFCLSRWVFLVSRKNQELLLELLVFYRSRERKDLELLSDPLGLLGLEKEPRAFVLVVGASWSREKTRAFV